MLYACIALDGAGNSRGFGFVHFPDANTARTARDGMDGKPIEGKSLTVRLRRWACACVGEGRRQGLA